MSKKCFVCGKKLGFLSGITTYDKQKICNDDLNRLFNKSKGKLVSLNATNWASGHSSTEIKKMLDNGEIVKNENVPKPFYKKAWPWFVVILALATFGSVSSGSHSSSSSSSSSSAKQSSEKADSESEKVEKEKVKNTCNALNQQFSQHEELQGFKLKPAAGDQFTVEVPSTATALSDNEQKSVYQNILKLIYSYDNGTNEGTMVEFQDQMGNMVARSSYTGDGEIKLYK